MYFCTVSHIAFGSAVWHHWWDGAPLSDHWGVGGVRIVYLRWAVRAAILVPFCGAATVLEARQLQSNKNQPLNPQPSEDIGDAARVFSFVVFYHSFHNWRPRCMELDYVKFVCALLSFSEAPSGPLAGDEARFDIDWKFGSFLVETNKDLTRSFCAFLRASPMNAALASFMLSLLRLWFGSLPERLLCPNFVLSPCVYVSQDSKNSLNNELCLKRENESAFWTHKQNEPLLNHEEREKEKKD